MQTIKCRDCSHEMNIATGTFGLGIPLKCPNCEKQPFNFDVIMDGWHARNCEHVFETNGKSETCKFCKITKVHAREKPPQ